MKLLAPALWIALVLYWTNPSLNSDGTPCTDLSLIRFQVTHKATNQTYWADYPLWYMEGPDTLWRSHESLDDYAREFALPRASFQYDWWRITAYGVDFSGNQSDSSNTISVTAPIE